MLQCIAGELVCLAEMPDLLCADVPKHLTGHRQHQEYVKLRALTREVLPRQLPDFKYYFSPLHLPKMPKSAGDWPV